MKQIFNVLLIAFLPFMLNAQTKINGIGLFKLGALKSKVLDSLVKITGRSILEVNYQPVSEVFEKKLDGVYKLNHSTNCPLEDEYQIYSIEILFIQIKEITIKFYNDSLYSLECKGSSELDDALDTKYGKAKIEEDTKIIYCQNNFTGAKIQHQENDFTKTWRKDKQVECWRLLSNYYNDDCKEKHLYGFYLINLILDKEANDCWRAEYKKKTEDKKNKLDKF